MGIFEYLKKRRRKKSMEKAFEKGAELDTSNKVFVPTTSGLKEVSKESTIGQQEVARATEIVRRGSGRSGSSGTSTRSSADQLKEKIGGKIISTNQVSFKPSSGNTIQSQLGPKPSSLQAPSDNISGYETASFRQAFFQTGANVLSRFSSPTKDKVPVQEIISPFDRTVKPMASETALVFNDKLLGGGKLTRFQIEQARKFGAKETTLGSEQLSIQNIREREIEKERRRLQGEIDLGSLNLTSANEQFTNFQNKTYRENPDIKGIKGTQRSPVRDIVDLALFSNAVTSSIATAVSSKSDPLKIDLDQISKGVSISGATTSKPSLRTASFAAGTAFNAARGLAIAGKGVTTSNVEAALEGASLSQRGARIKSGGGFLDISSGTARTSGTTQATINTVSLTTPIKGTEKFVTGGTSNYGVIGRTYFGGKPFFLGGSSEFTATSISYSGGKIVPTISRVGLKPTTSFSAVSSKKGLVGEAFAYKEGEKTFQTLGLGYKQGDLIFGTGGRVSSISGRGTQTKGAAFFEGVGVKAPKESESLLFSVSPKTDTSVKGFLGGRSGRQTPLSETFSAPPISTNIPKPKGGFKPAVVSEDLISSSKATTINLQGVKTNIETTKTSSTYINDFNPLQSKIKQQDFSDIKIGNFIDTDVKSDSRNTGRVRTRIRSDIDSRSVPDIKSISDIKIKQIQKPLLDPPLFTPFSPTKPGRGPFIGFDPFIGFKTPSLNIPGSYKREVIPREKKGGRISPSLTGIVFEVETGIPDIDPLIGISPLDIRGIGKAKKKKKKKK